MLFSKLSRRIQPQVSPARVSYDRIVAQARHPAFYLAGGIEDSLDGRFDMIVMHAVLVITRLNEETDERAGALSQEIFDVMFQDMDRSLREMGVGDMSVGRQVKKMAEAFYGRARAYDEAMKAFADDPGELEAAVARNLLVERGRGGRARRFANYMMSSRVCLRGCFLGELCEGRVKFSTPESAFGRQS